MLVGIVFWALERHRTQIRPQRGDRAADLMIGSSREASRLTEEYNARRSSSPPLAGAADRSRRAIARLTVRLRADGMR
jgi:hypothetical protein